MTREANKRFFGSLEEVPTAAYTMGVGTVMAARSVLMIVTGADKAQIVKESFTSKLPKTKPFSVKIRALQYRMTIQPFNTDIPYFVSIQ